MEKNTYSIKLSVSEFEKLEQALGHILDQSDKYGVFENNLLSDMAFGHIDPEEPEMIEPILETVSTISSTFLAIANDKILLRNVMIQLLEIRIENGGQKRQLATMQN